MGRGAGRFETPVQVWAVPGKGQSLLGAGTLEAEGLRWGRGLREGGAGEKVKGGVGGCSEVGPGLGGKRETQGPGDAQRGVLSLESCSCLGLLSMSMPLPP